MPAVAQGETVPYLICVEKDAEGNVGANQKGLAERAHHPEEVNAASNLAIDVEYYLTQQVLLALRLLQVQLNSVCQAERTWFIQRCVTVKQVNSCTYTHAINT